jgi:TetR/AcrR family transcriptional regulator, cholesterol catabolism regulator
LELKEHILATAYRLFMTYGIRSITMDDLSKELSVSKKTIYQHFKDKDEIVYITTNMALKHEQKYVDEIQQQAQNAIDELMLMTKFMREHISKINPSVLFDIKKYYREAWQLYLTFKEEVFINAVRNSLKRGIEEGYFRPAINVDILAALRLEMIQLCFDDSVFPGTRFEFKEVQMQIFDHFIHGILTPKGLEAFQQQTKINETEK